MIIEIRGTGFINKGAELMLYAVMAKLKEKYSDAKICMAPMPTAPYEKRISIDLYQKAQFWKKGIQFGLLANLIPSSLRKSYGIILDKEVDVVIDAAGFAYSDQWGKRSCFELYDSCKRWRNNGTKVILLPQAFGPFDSKQNKYFIRESVKNIDLIFAREQISYEYLLSTVGEKNNILQAHDFTNLIEGFLPENFDKENNRFCIVPNYRMVDKTSEDESKAYLPFLIKCAKHLLEKNKKPFILVHEGENDMMLAKQINDAIDFKLPIIQEPHPLKIKGIIGACEGIISSRFHGLVSGLSQGVPSLATGWSHKYKMLFQDYDFEEGLLDVLMSDEELEKIINLVTEEKSKLKIKNKLSQKAEELKNVSNHMWNKVFKIIDEKSII